MTATTLQKNFLSRDSFIEKYEQQFEQIRRHQNSDFSFGIFISLKKKPV